MTHGTTTGYRQGCRCEECCQASRSYRQRYRRERLGQQPMGARRRELIEDAVFLHTAGETPDRIAERLGLKRGSLERAFYREGVTFPWSKAVHQSPVGAA